MSNTTRRALCSLLCAPILTLSAGHAGAQTPGQVPVFVDASGNIGDSAVRQDPGEDGNNHVGIGTPGDFAATLALAENRNGRLTFAQVQNTDRFPAPASGSSHQPTGATG